MYVHNQLAIIDTGVEIWSAGAFKFDVEEE